MNQCFHQLPPLSPIYPWFVAQILGGPDEDSSRNQYFYTQPDPLIEYHCQIPELLGRRIRGYYHGWVVLSDHLQNVMWSLWNPVTSKMIPFPPLNLKDGDSGSIRECCLSAPPDDPSSVLVLTRTNKPAFVFLRLKVRRKKLKWIEMSYASQLKRITGEDGDLLNNVTCCNGKLYALNTKCSYACFVIQVDILVRDKEVLITFSLLGSSPTPSYWMHPDAMTFLLKGYDTELFCIIVCSSKKELEGVCLFRLDLPSLKSEEMKLFKALDMSRRIWGEEELDSISMSRKLWNELVDFEDAVFFVDLNHDNLAYYRPGIALELGGYIHIRDRTHNKLYSFHLKNYTISLSSMPSPVLPTSKVSLWECRLEDDHEGTNCALDIKQEEKGIAVRSVTDNENEVNDGNLLNFPLHILEMIMEHCLCVEYMNFRATCKRCEAAAPLIQWSNKTSLMRLQTYSLVSPWLMVVDNNLITFIDPMLGKNYFMKKLHVSIPDRKILCSRFGWLFFFSSEINGYVLYNPFCCDLRKLPVTSCGLNAACFSAPPTSPDCMVAGFPKDDESLILIHYVAREQSWRPIRVGTKLNSICFPTFFGRDLYALVKDGRLIRLKKMGEEAYCRVIVEATTPIGYHTSQPSHYLMNSGQNILKVIVGKFGKHVEVFKWDVSNRDWEKIDSLGNRMTYICEGTCLCIEAKTRKMENKIYFPSLHSKNKKIVYYSLETCTLETSDGENIQKHSEGFSGTTSHLFPHAWIEPSWL